MSKVINACLKIVTFFMYSGFFAVISLVVTFVGPGGYRIVSIPIRLITIMGMIIIILYWRFHKKRVMKNNIFSLLFICFWIFYFVKIMWHYSAGYPLSIGWSQYMFYALNLCILPFLTFVYIPFDKYKKTILSVLIFSGFMMGIMTTFLYRNFIGSDLGRISMAKYVDPSLVTLNPLSLAYASVLTIMLCVYELLYKQNKTKWYSAYMYLTIALSFVMFLLGASRGSLLAIFVSVVYFIYTSPLKVKLKSYAIIGLSIPLLAWGVAKSGSVVFARSINSFQSGSTGRESLWANAWQEFLNFPIFGRKIEIGFYPHNIILEILMAMGIFGLLIFVPLLSRGLQKSISLVRKDKNYIWVSIILLQGICQYLFSSSLYKASLLFFPLGILLQSEISRYRDLNE